MDRGHIVEDGLLFLVIAAIVYAFITTAFVPTAIVAIVYIVYGLTFGFYPIGGEAVERMRARLARFG